MSIEVLSIPKRRLADVTFKWFQAFVHTARVVVEMAFPPITYLSDIPCVWLEALMHCADVSLKVPFPPKRLHTTFPFTGTCAGSEISTWLQIHQGVRFLVPGTDNHHN